MRVVRILLGLVAIVIALPLLAAGAVLGEASRHRAPDGSFSAQIVPVSGPGYAVVVPNVDTLLRRDAPFARGDRTTLRITARSGTGPAFVGLAPWAAVQRYLVGVPYTTVSEVRLARGPLPVTATDVPGITKPADVPAVEPFWVTASASGDLTWTPAALRGQNLALVVMDPRAASGIRVDLVAGVAPAWLGPKIWGLLALGLIAVGAALVAFCWPPRRREVVYVVEPAQLSDLSARLGLPQPSAGDGADDALGLFRPAPVTTITPEPPPNPITPPSWLTDTGPIEPDPVEAPVPLATGQGTYRSVTAPAPITPSFVWPPVPADSSREPQPH